MEVKDLVIILMIAFSLDMLIGIGRKLKKFKDSYELVETSRYGWGLRDLSIRIILKTQNVTDSYLKLLAKAIIAGQKADSFTIWIYYPGDDTNQKARIMLEINPHRKITIDRLN